MFGARVSSVSGESWFKLSGAFNVGNYQLIYEMIVLPGMRFKR